MNKVLVTGATGQLGNELQRLVELKSLNEITNFIFVSTKDCDLTKKGKIENVIEQVKPNLILHAAAYTAVDKAEDESAVANLINGEACRYISQAALKVNAKVVGISTDFVFNGKKSLPYHPEDATDPLSVYGSSKLLGENLLLENNPNSVVIRTSWVYSTFGHNFVKSMRNFFETRDKLTIVYDQVGTPTYARDLANLLVGFVEQPDQLDVLINDENRTYHYSNEGVASWYDFAKIIQGFSDDIVSDCNILPIESRSFTQKALRPKYSVLGKGKIKNKLNIEIPYWQDSLKVMVEELMGKEIK